MNEWAELGRDCTTTTMELWSLAYMCDHFSTRFGRIFEYFLKLSLFDLEIVVEYRVRAIPGTGSDGVIEFHYNW